mgnify:CR=1 FL=1
MRSIQENILEVLKARAEEPGPPLLDSSPPPRLYR